MTTLMLLWGTVNLTPMCGLLEMLPRSRTLVSPPLRKENPFFLLSLALHIQPLFNSGFPEGEIRHEEGQQART